MDPPLSEKVKFDENEVKFEYWELLPLEIRFMIAKETDVMTRFSLMFSSKSNYEIARSVPIRIESITVKDEKEYVYDEIDHSKKFISVQLEKYDPSEIITIICFVEDRDGTMVYRYWNKNNDWLFTGTMLLESTNYWKASMLFLERLMTLMDYQIDAFQMGVDYGQYNLEFLEKLRIKKELNVIASDVVYLNNWLNTANSPLKKLEIDLECNGCDRLSHSDRFYLNQDVINNSKELRFTSGACSSKTLDFPELKCDKFDIFAPEVTLQVVNQFVKKWINGDLHANFSRGEFSSSNFFTHRENKELLMRGIDSSPWHPEYRIGEKRLRDILSDENVCAFERDCCYIETRKRDNGAVLIFGESRAILLVAGKQHLWT